MDILKHFQTFLDKKRQIVSHHLTSSFSKYRVWYHFLDWETTTTHEMSLMRCEKGVS